MHLKSRLATTNLLSDIINWTDLALLLSVTEHPIFFPFHCGETNKVKYFSLVSKAIKECHMKCQTKK